MASLETQIKYLRIQLFYKHMRTYDCFTHSFIEAVICKFFHIRESTTVSRILNERVEQGVDFPDSDLDSLWIKAYIKKHFHSKKLENEEPESQPLH